MMSKKLFSITILLLSGFIQCSQQHENPIKTDSNEALISLKNDSSTALIKYFNHNGPHQLRNQKYSSKILESRFSSTEKVFGIRTFPVSNSNLEKKNIKTETKMPSSTEKVLDFRIDNFKKKNHDKTKTKVRDENNKKKDMITASAGNGKQKNDIDEEAEKTLAQQVADGKYGLIQNEIFANGSKRPGILSYTSNTEVPKDTKDNLGGLEKDEIWLAEDHILVLRGGNYQDIKENETSSPMWPQIDDYQAPNRQVKLPKNPDIPPPFPVQLTDDGPIEFIKGHFKPSPLPPIILSLSNKTLSFPNSPSSDTGNKTLPFPIPPHLIPPFLSNLPPGATFVAPPDNQTHFDEDDPSIYYPPKYDFYYPQDNTTEVPPGPLVPGIILPPPPNFFSLFENSTDSRFENQNENNDNINSITPNTFQGPKYLPFSPRKPNKQRISTNTFFTRPNSFHNVSDSKNDSKSTLKSEKPKITIVYPENSKSKFFTTSTPSNSFRTSIKVPTNKYLNSFTSPIFVPNNPNKSIYHPLPTTSPKPNHITLPTTKALPKQIFIITTPETVDKNRIEDIYKETKPFDIYKYEHISPEIHPLRSLIKPNVTVSYNGKYGHLPSTTDFHTSKPQDDNNKIIRGHYVTKPPVTKASKIPSTDINSVTVTPIPVVKKIRINPIRTEKPEVITPPSNPPKATFYFYEESSTTKNPSRIQMPEKSKEISTQIQVETNLPVKNEVKPFGKYYYTTMSTNKTPIRQFLEETFHSSNVLPRKPQIAHINNAEIINQNSYSDIPKMKHLNYGTQTPSKQTIKYHYVTEDNTAIIPNPKIKDLEIKNSGSSGLQNVNEDTTVVRPATKPIIQQTPKLEIHNPLIVSYATTPNPIKHQNEDSPFIPSNYYATVRPEHIHFTSQEQTLVDDITKNYFTIFGQKINSVSTTPLTPIKSTIVKNKSKPESGLTYISDDGHNFKIQQTHEKSSGKPAKLSTHFYSNENSKPSTTSRPPSNFEKYLKELTGEDQKDYIISGLFPLKIKKGKEFLEPSHVERIPIHLLPQRPIDFQNKNSPISLMNNEKNSNERSNVLKLLHPNFSTTLRPVNIEIKSQYVQPISSTAKPFTIYQPQILPQSFRFNQNFQQYLQEITGLTSPTTTRPIKVKKPNLEFFPTTASPVKPIGFQQTSFHIPEVKPKPISLESDILVNYKQLRPVINNEAELINIHNPALSFDVSPNIRIINSPDLSRNPNQPYSTKQIAFGVAKDFFENLPKSEYYSPPHQSRGNSFVSYNLPGNGGHFYFLTPQILQKQNEEEINRQDKDYKRINRSKNTPGTSPEGTEIDGYSSQIKHNLEDGYSNRDYLRRRRKKP